MRAALALAALLLVPAAAWAGTAPGSGAQGGDGRLEVVLHEGDTGPDADTRLDAAVIVRGPGRLASYLGLDGALLLQPDRSAGIATEEVERLDLSARAGLMVTTSRATCLRLFVTVVDASLDEDRFGARAGNGFTDFGIAFLRVF